MSQAVAAGLDGRAQVSALFRWSALFMMSFVVLGVYYAYDALNPIGGMLVRELGISEAEFGVLKQTAVSIPNVLILIVGGIIIDRIGARLGGGIFAFACLLGTLLTAVGGQMESYWVMFFGRILFGSGVESLLIAQNKIITKWFAGKELSLAFAINLAICRFGTLFAFMSVNGMANSMGWQNTLWAIAGLMAVCFATFIVYTFMDRHMERKVSVQEEKSDQIDFKQVFGLPASFWFITALCVTFYCAVFPFLDFATQVFEARFGMSEAYGSTVAGAVIMLTIVFTPFFGWLCDRIGRRATMMIIGASLIVPIHLAIGFLGGGTPAARPAEPFLDIVVFQWYAVFPFNGTDAIPILPVMCLGIAFSLVPAAMWPSVARMVDQKRLGTAYGIMFLIQNIGLMGMSPMVGWGKLPFQASAFGPFQVSMMLLAGLGLIGAIFAVLLKIADRKAAVSIEVPEGR